MEDPTVLISAKPWWMSRTILLNGIGVIVLGLSLVMGQAGQLGISDKVLAWLGVVLALCNALLRFDTTAPIGRSGELVEVAGEAGPVASKLTQDQLLAMATMLRDLAMQADVPAGLHTVGFQVPEEVPFRG